MIPLPYLLGAALISVLLALGGGYFMGRSDGRALEAGEQDRVALAVAAAEQAMQRVAAESISKIEVRNVTIRQKAETVTREVPVYRDCKHDPDGLRLINDALDPTGAFPTPDSKLPATDPAD